MFLCTHLSSVEGGFFHLCQLRRVRPSLDSEAVSTLVHSFVSSRVDYYNCLMVGAPKKWTETLQRVMNAAARVLTQTKKYDKWLTRMLHDKLHWFDVSERIQFKLCIHVYRCLHGIAPKIHDESMPTCIYNWGMQSPAFSGERAAWCATSKAINVWEKGFLIHWSISMELTAQLP